MRAFRIQVTKYQIPEWLRAKAIKGLTSGPDYLWIKGSRLKAWMVARERELGSEPEVIEVEIRKCPICGKLQLAGDAREQRSRLERYYGESIPCDPDCVVRTNFKRGIK